MIDTLKQYLRIDEDTWKNDVLPFLLSVFVSVYAILLVLDGYYSLVFLLIGFILGAFYFSDDTQRLEIRPYEISHEEYTVTEDEVAELNLFYAPLTVVMNQLKQYIIRDFVLSWWSPINTYNNPTFEKMVHERLNTVILNVEKILLNQDRNDIIMSTVYGVANTLIIHMRECRDYENSNESMDDYVARNPQSPFAQLLNKEDQHRLLLNLSQSFLKRTLPPSDKESTLLLSLFKELLASFVFGSVVDTISNPDFLNCWIVNLLSDADKAEIISPQNIDQLIHELGNTDNDHEDVYSLPSPKQSMIIEPIINVASEDDNDSDQSNKSDSTEQVTPPGTPESIKLYYNPKEDCTQISASSNKGDQPGMIFSHGSVNFTVMDISTTSYKEHPIDKSSLVYIIQIERAAIDEHASSEGGGYVITRSYIDFENFNTILHARHPRRTAKLQLKLPLDTPRSWLKSTTQPKKRWSMDSMCHSLEHYIDLVAKDSELGADSIIATFLRKERRSEVGQGGVVLSFTEECKEELATISNNIVMESSNSSGSFTRPNRSRSLFSRNNNSHSNLVSLSSMTPKFNADTSDDKANSSNESDSITDNKRWFAGRITREGSVSSIKSAFSKDDVLPISSPPIDEKAEYGLDKSKHEDDPPTKQHTPLKRTHTHTRNKALSSMDVELLIETTYSLIVEIFNLTPSNNKAWMRRSILNLLREIVRRSYVQFISEQYNDFVNENMSPDAIVSRLNQLGEQLWPEGKWMYEKEQATSRTERDKEYSKQQARVMLMNRVIPSTVRQLIGDQNSNTAMDRIWARCQDPNLNRVLVLQILERIVKPILG
ncbi:PXA domain-containing protein [Pilobolus umbonatus]|nr:PXA domain-containing protein [Pilobolus umbonatus]